MNKGFTLIELLAVIIIICLISLLSIISVSNIVTKSKNDLYNEQISMIDKAARSWGSENIDKLPNEDECIYLKLSDLKTYGLLDSNLKDPRSNNKISDEMTIKISGELNDYDKLIIEYEVDSSDVVGCKYMYGDYTLVEGDTFNRTIKSFVNGKEIDLDEKIKSIVFLNVGNLPEGVTSEDLNSNVVDLSVNSDMSVLGYFINDILYIFSNGDNYISEGVLQANSISDRMFYGLTELEAIEFGTLNTEGIVSMSSMFEKCYKLEYLNLSSFDTSSVLRMNDIFRECTNLKYLNINNFVVSRLNSSSNANAYSNMFMGCNNLEIVINPDIKDFINARLGDNHTATLIIK